MPSPSSPSEQKGSRSLALEHIQCCAISSISSSPCVVVERHAPSWDRTPSLDRNPPGIARILRALTSSRTLSIVFRPRHSISWDRTHPACLDFITNSIDSLSTEVFHFLGSHASCVPRLHRWLLGLPFHSPSRTTPRPVPRAFCRARLSRDYSRYRLSRCGSASRHG